MLDPWWNPSLAMHLGFRVNKSSDTDVDSFNFLRVFTKRIEVMFEFAANGLLVEFLSRCACVGILSDADALCRMFLQSSLEDPGLFCFGHYFGHHIAVQALRYQMLLFWIFLVYCAARNINFSWSLSR